MFHIVQRINRNEAMPKIRVLGAVAAMFVAAGVNTPAHAAEPT